MLLHIKSFSGTGSDFGSTLITSDNSSSASDLNRDTLYLPTMSALDFWKTAFILSLLVS